MNKTLYFSDLCPNTVPLKRLWKRLGVTAREVNITASIEKFKNS